MSGSNDLALGYLGLRRAIGTLGLALPVVLLAGGAVLFDAGQQPSISDYHGTGMRDVFVGLLFAIGVFLWAYRGYDRADAWTGRFAGTCAVAVALFPNTGGTKVVHFTAAALFFLALAGFSFFLFTKSSEPKDERPAGKRRRNAVYRACGIGIVVCIGLILAYKGVEGDIAWLDTIGPVFWLEALAVWLFGASWLVKGDALEKGIVPERVQAYFRQEQAGA